ncbi:Uncharacterised protein [Vibrio cholerae]|uniref:Uncharacterized protein n=1 Tax=Vibrio cholerae TaxID=666 RepID=A0A655PLG2_VIBCL|nr:Uncharacterised protein [Vibrio cholerae]
MFRHRLTRGRGECRRNIEAVTFKWDQHRPAILHARYRAVGRTIVKSNKHLPTPTLKRKKAGDPIASLLLSLEEIVVFDTHSRRALT